jgi:nucleoside-diphosphate-sugar epimerase
MPRLPDRDLEHVLLRTGTAWDALRGARVLLTGGTGFFGRWLVESFAHANARFELGAELVVLSRDPDAFLRRAPHLAGAPSIRYLTGDVRTFDAPGGALTHVIHGATATTGTLNADQPLEMLDTIVQGTRRTLDVAVAAGARRVLLLGSGAVYGKQPAVMTHVSEGYAGSPDPLDPGQAYAEGKRTAELLGAVYRRDHGLDVISARCFAFVGPHLPLDAHFAIGNFIRDALRGDGIAIGGDGSPYRSYLHAADLTIWLWTLLARGTPGQAYNVGSEESVTIRQLADTVARVSAAVLHRSLTVSQRREPDPARPAERYVPSTRRARDELGLRSWISLEDAIARTLAWHVEHAEHVEHAGLSDHTGHAAAPAAGVPLHILSK